MGSITITVPQNIHITYNIENTSFTKSLLDVLNALMLRSVAESSEEDRLLGLFNEKATLLDQITEQSMQSRETDPLRVH